MVEEESLADQAVIMSVGAWSKGILPELVFWKNWLATKGAQWSYEFEERLDKNKEITGILATILSSRENAIKILDVGAGPITSVGKKHKGKFLDVEATDALADFYNVFLEEESISPPARTKFSTAEDLSLFYDDSCFDIVHCRNALDHSFDPVRAVVEMLRVVKVGGMIVLDHHENEAEGETYSGFHQYNFTEENGDFVVWNRDGKINIKSTLPVDVSISTRRADENIIVTIEKKSEFSDVQQESRHRKRAASLLRSLVNYYGSEAMKNL